MAHAKITLIGFHKYTDGHIWDKMTLPQGVDKDTLINNIMLEYGEDEVFYSDPEFFTNAIGIWSKKWNHTISRWIKALNTEYEPLWNIDRFEDVTDSPDIITTMQGNSHSESTGENLYQRNTFDDDTFHDAERSTDSSANNVSDASTSHQTGNAVHKGHYYGNGGVTSSQALLREEFSIATFNLYNEIAELFARDLLIDSFF